VDIAICVSDTGQIDIFFPVLWIPDILVRILLFSSVIFNIPTKIFLQVFFAYFEDTFTSFFNDKKSHKEVAKQQKSRVSLLFLLDDGSIRIHFIQM
jgi:hypothetical protein